MKESGAAPRPAERSSAVATGDAGRPSVRWLAELCGLSPQDHLPFLASDMVARQEQAAEVFLHIGWWARHPDADSNFARSIGRLPDIADAELFAALIQKGYDGLLYTNENEIIGHCFFQRHGSRAAWVFGVGQRAASRRKFDDDRMLRFHVLCFGMPRYRRGQIWHRAPGRPAAEAVEAVQRRPGWQVRRGGWVDFSANGPKRASPGRGTG